MRTVEWTAFSLAVGLLTPSAALGGPGTLNLEGKSTAVQQILVIPVVGSDYGYNAADRDLEAHFPGVYQEILSKYVGTGMSGGPQNVADFWQEASYGNVRLDAEVPDCFYQIEKPFSTVGEEAFQRALVTGVEVYPYLVEPFGAITLDYQASGGPQNVTLTFDTTLPTTTQEEVTLVVTDALVAAGVDHELEFLGSGTVSAEFTFAIVQNETRAGSYVRINKAASDEPTRAALGFYGPELSQPDPNTLIVTTDGVDLPAYFFDSDLSFQFYDGDALVKTFDWDTSALTATCVGTTCGPWETPAGLSSLIEPKTPGTGTIETIPGSNNVRFVMTFVDPVVADSFRAVANGSYPDSFKMSLGVAQQTLQAGTTSQDDNRHSGDLVRQALGALLSTELADGLSSCLASAVGTVAIPTPPVGAVDDPAFATAWATYNAQVAAARAPIDSYMARYSAVHVVLLSDDASVIRPNAWSATLPVVLTDAATGSMPYPIETALAAIGLKRDWRTFAHEVGHNLGFPDLYNFSNDESSEPSEFDPRLKYAGTWDIMGTGADTHTAAFNKQSYHGWVSSPGSNHGQIITVEPGNETSVVLSPLEYPRAAYDDALGVTVDGLPVAKMLILPLSGPPPAGKLVPDHYLSVEYRQAGPDYSQSLSSAGGVYVTDNVSTLNYVGDFGKHVSRLHSHPLGWPSEAIPLDGQTTFPGYPGLEVAPFDEAAGPDSINYMKVRVNFPVQPLMDLRIEPWSIPEYATRAIWFQHGAEYDPNFPPVKPADLGNIQAPIYIADYKGSDPLNYIHIAVDNAGTEPAYNVQLKVSFNAPGDASSSVDWDVLEITDPQDIPAGGTVTFSVPWSPGRTPGDPTHTCIAAEVYRWESVEGVQVRDMNPGDNTAQENIFQMDVISNSPWHKVPFEFEVHNSYNREVTVDVLTRGLQQGQSVELSESVMRLPGHTSRIISGAYRWDSNLIPTPPSQDPADPYWQACQDGGTCADTVYEAEDMFHSGGSAVEGGWRLLGDDYVATVHDFQGSQATIRVRAAAGTFSDEWPSMLLTLDDAVIGEATVTNSESWAEYTFTTHIDPGTQELRLYIDDGGDPYRALFLDSVTIECGESSKPAHCGGLWSIETYARMGDYRVPLGGIGYQATGRPTATLDTDVSIDSEGEVTVSCGVLPAAGDQTIRIIVTYPNGEKEVVDKVTGPDGTIEHSFVPEWGGPLTIQTELPTGGGPFAPTMGDPIEIDACIPAASESGGTSGGTCSNEVHDGDETGVDCGGSCVACAAPSCSPGTYEAEDMFHSTGGSVSNGWNIWSNGFIKTSHDFSAVSTTVTVRARGRLAGWESPHMTVRVGGVVVGQASVSSTSWQDYVFSFAAASGVQDVEVSFDNDYYAPPQDRDLIVDHVTIDCQ